MKKPNETYMYDIIVCGSNTVDAFLKTDADLVSFNSPEHNHKLIAFPVGTKLPVNELEFHIGGGGTNVAATFRAQELRTAYIGKVGKDVNGHKVFEWLKSHDIDFLGQVGGETGFSAILDTAANDRTILTFKGANNSLSFDEIPQHRLETKWFYGCAMREESFSCLEKLFVFMKNHGRTTVFNPNPVLAKEGIGQLSTILKHTDILVLNKEEAQYLVKGDDTMELAHHLVKKGPKTIAITDGEEGVTIHCVAGEKEQNFHLKPNPDRKIVETTGAGDAFASAFVTGLIKEKGLEVAARMGILNAESIISHCGTKEHVLSTKEIEKALERYTHKS